MVASPAGNQAASPKIDDSKPPAGQSSGSEQSSPAVDEDAARSGSGSGDTEKKVAAASPKPAAPTQGPLPAPPKTAKKKPADPEAEARIQQLRKLIDEGMDVNGADEEGRTALMIAAFDGHSDVVQLLLDKGAEVDHLDAQGRSALMYAASGPFPETVDLLLRWGAKVNQVDTNEGWTALMLAAAEGQTQVVQRLLEAGADKAIRDKDGDTALDHASRRKQGATMALLK